MGPMRTPLLSPAESPDLCRHDPAYLKQLATAKPTPVGMTPFGIGVGVFLIGLGWFDWSTTAAFPMWVPIGAGVFIVALSVGMYPSLRSLSRILRRTVTTVRLTREGLHATLLDGTTLFVAWGDPRFALDCSVGNWPGKQPPVTYGLRWLMNPKTAGCELSPGGMSQLLTAVRNHGLVVTGKTFGSGPSTFLRLEIRFPEVSPA